MQKTIVKFDIGQLLPIGMTIVVLGIALAYGLSVMSEVQSDMVDSSYHCGLNTTNGTSGTLVYDGCGAAYNASGSAIEGVSKLPEKLPLIVTVVIAAVIIGIIVRYLWTR